MTNTLTITVEASFDSNDHQARLLIDGKDWLGPKALGLDPPMLKSELFDKGGGTLIVGRCWCGVVGCGDLNVEVTRTPNSVHWSESSIDSLRFDAAQYDAEVIRFAHDRSWETVQRAVEREIEHIFHGTTIEHGYEFEWASTRIEEGQVKLSFQNGHLQKLLQFPWDEVSLEDATNRARAFRAARFPHCD